MDDPKYAWSNQPPKKVEVVDLTNVEGAGRKIVCSPVPGKDGIEYVPDWYGLTHFD